MIAAQYLATEPDARFADAAVPMSLLRERAHNLRWATLPPDVIALTAADPDFAVAAPIREAITDYVGGGVFSYGPPAGLPEFRQACARVLQRRKGWWSCEPTQILAVDSAAAGMLHVARFALAPGDEAIVFDPVDFIFTSAVEAAGGVVRRLPLDPQTGRFSTEALAGLVTARTRLLCVCNPHNPTGRVFSAEELRALGDLAVAHDLWILNDEIWSDIVFAPTSFVSLPTLGDAIADRTITVHGLSKTFGLAGLRVGFIAAPSAEVARQLLAASLASSTMTGVSTLSQVAATAAYSHDWDWADGFVAHLHRQRDHAVARLARLPGIEVRVPEGTYVLFPKVTVRDPRTGAAMRSEALAAHLLERGRVAVVPGATRWFGPGAEGHLRLVFSTSRAILDEGLDRIAFALAS